MRKFEVENHEQSYLPEGDWELAWADEFDGTELDRTMWSAFGTQSPTIGARFEPEWCGIESDIMECFRADKVTSGNILGGYFSL